MKTNNKIILITFIAILVLIIVGILAYTNNSFSTKYTDFSSDKEYSNATVVLDIPEGEEGEAPGSCKVSLVSKSAAYPVEISDISTFYNFSEYVADCSKGSLTVYDPITQEKHLVSFVSIILDGSTEGVVKTDVTTGVSYTINSAVTSDVLTLSLTIDEVEDESIDKREVVRSILLSEAGGIFYGAGNYELLNDYESLDELGLQLNYE